MVPGASAAAAVRGIFKIKKATFSSKYLQENIKRYTTRGRQKVRVNRKKRKTLLKKKYPIKEKKQKHSQNKIKK